MKDFYFILLVILPIIVVALLPIMFHIPVYEDALKHGQTVIIGL